MAETEAKVPEIFLRTKSNAIGKLFRSSWSGVNTKPMESYESAAIKALDPSNDYKKPFPMGFKSEAVKRLYERSHGSMPQAVNKDPNNESGLKENMSLNFASKQSKEQNDGKIKGSLKSTFSNVGKPDKDEPSAPQAPASPSADPNIIILSDSDDDDEEDFHSVDGGDEKEAKGDEGNEKEAKGDEGNEKKAKGDNDDPEINQSSWDKMSVKELENLKTKLEKEFDNANTNLIKDLNRTNLSGDELQKEYSKQLDVIMKKYKLDELSELIDKRKAKDAPSSRTRSKTSKPSKPSEPIIADLSKVGSKPSSPKEIKEASEAEKEKGAKNKEPAVQAKAIVDDGITKFEEAMLDKLKDKDIEAEVLYQPRKAVKTVVFKVKYGDDEVKEFDTLSGVNKYLKKKDKNLHFRSTGNKTQNKRGLQIIDLHDGGGRSMVKIGKTYVGPNRKFAVIPMFSDDELEKRSKKRARIDMMFDEGKDEPVGGVNPKIQDDLGVHLADRMEKLYDKKTNMKFIVDDIYDSFNGYAKDDMFGVDKSELSKWWKTLKEITRKNADKWSEKKREDMKTLIQALADSFSNTRFFESAK